MTAKQSPQKVRDYEARKKAAGLRRVLVWVRDTPERVEAVRRRAQEVSDPDWKPE